MLGTFVTGLTPHAAEGMAGIDAIGEISALLQT
jgi:hypothetical protein